MRTPLAILGLMIVVLGVLGFGAVFTVDERSQALVLQFGEHKRTITEPGLHFKLPLIQDVRYFDRRVLNLDPPSEEVLLSDQKRIVVDAYARYNIVDARQFYQAINNEAALRDRFGKTMNSTIRNVLGLHPLTDLLSSKRTEIMANIQARVASSAQEFGIKVIDLRIGRAELPEDISNTVYDRMRSEREREANLLRAEGEELKQRITANADRQRTVILAEANKQAQITIGEGEAERNRITSEAYGQSPEFFGFIRSMGAYREAIGEGTTMVLSPDSDFFRYLDSRTGAPRAPGQ